MTQELDELVSLYERGIIARRGFLSALVALMNAPASAATPGLFPARNLTHVNIRVRDPKESERFYREMFGLPPAREVVGAAYALDLSGGGFISLCPLSNPDCGLSDSATPGEIDHFGVGIGNFRPGATASQLKGRGLETVDAGSSVFIKDPNGTWVQLSAPKETFRK